MENTKDQKESTSPISQSPDKDVDIIKGAQKIDELERAKQNAERENDEGREHIET